MSSDETPSLTPTEDLAIETLIARHRLGEHLWTFEARHARTLRSLETKGLVQFMNGCAANSVRASLTDKALSHYLDDRYVPPILRLECREWYIGPKTNGHRLDCERKNGHKGKHRYTFKPPRGEERVVKWTTVEADEEKDRYVERALGRTF